MHFGTVDHNGKVQDQKEYQHAPFTHHAVKGDANNVIPELEVILIADHSLILQTGLTVQGKQYSSKNELHTLFQMYIVLIPQQLLTDL